MALTDPSGDTIANLTDRARELIARAILGNVVFKAVGFGLGRGGYDPSDVVQTLPLNLTATELADKVFPSTTPFRKHCGFVSIYLQLDCSGVTQTTVTCLNW